MQKITRRVFWIVLTVASFTASWAMSVTGMIGGWNLHVNGITHGAVWDPGGPYFGSGMLLFEQRYAPFVGHPGLPLMLVSHVVARIMYLTHGVGGFQAYVATNLWSVMLASMLAMTALFLVAFRIVEMLAMRLLGDEGAAMLATAAFATSYPVLFYLNRLSPEPVLVITTLLAFLWLWRYHEAGTRGRRLWFLAWSAQAATAAIYTKLLIVGPIVPFIALEIACRRGIRRLEAIRDAALFVAFTVPLLVLGTMKIDWSTFFQFWFQYAPGRPRYAASSNWVMNVAGNMASTGAAMVSTALGTLFSGQFLPSLHTREGLFFASEGIVIIGGLAGLALYWRGCRNRPVHLTWFLAFIALTCIPYLQKGAAAWHYLFLQLAVLSVFFGYAVSRLMLRMTGHRPSTPGGQALGVALVLVVHALAIALAVDMSRYNASQFPRWEAFYRAPSQVSATGRIGLVDVASIDDIMQPIGTYLPLDGFLREFKERFVPVLSDVPDPVLRARGIERVIEARPDGTLTTRVVRSAALTSASPRPRASR